MSISSPGGGFISDSSLSWLSLSFSDHYENPFPSSESDFEDKCEALLLKYTDKIKTGSKSRKFGSFQNDVSSASRSGYRTRTDKSGYRNGNVDGTGKPVDKMKRKRVVATSKEDKKKMKEEEKKEKLRKKEASEQLKRIQPGTCMEFVTVHVDLKLVDCTFGPEILQGIVDNGSKSFVGTQKVPYSITWTTKTLSNGVEVDKNELPVLLIWNAEQFLLSMQDNTLNKQINSVQKKIPNCKLTLVIFRLEDYLREQDRLEKRLHRELVLNEETDRRGKKCSKKFQNFNFSRSDVEDVLVDLQLLSDCQTRIADTAKDVGSIVHQFTKAIAETPYKLEKQKQQVDGLGWLATCDLRDCIRVDKSGNGLSRLWLQQLMQFNNCGLDVAQAIVQHYPTPLALYKAYCSCDFTKKGEDLLKDILLRRGFGEAAATRRVGPDLSKKIYRFFTSLDGNLPLSQE